jgi:hypothetical protein
MVLGWLAGLAFLASATGIITDTTTVVAATTVVAITAGDITVAGADMVAEVTVEADITEPRRRRISSERTKNSGRRIPGLMRRHRVGSATTVPIDLIGSLLMADA